MEELILYEAFAASGTTTLLIGIAVWLSRTWITARLTADLRLETESHIEDLRSQLKRANDSLGAVTSAGQNAFSQVQIAQLPFKIKAIERVWNSVIAWNEYSVAATFVAILPIDWVRKYGSDPKTKENFEILLKNPEHITFLKDRNDTELVRPFLSDQSWALYAAYSSFYSSRLMKASILLLPSVDHAEIWERVNERELVKASAPEDILKQYDSNPLIGANAYLTYLKDQMIEEFQNELSGSRDSDNAVLNTSATIAAAEALVQSSKHQPAVPSDGTLDITT